MMMFGAVPLYKYTNMVELENHDLAMLVQHCIKLILNRFVSEPVLLECVQHFRAANTAKMDSTS